MIATLSQSFPTLMQEHGILLIFVFAFGACVGSFVNVVNYRLPAGMSVSRPPSRCPVCGIRLRFFKENLPIIGWLLLRGKCRTCETKISVEYVLFEIFMGLLFVGLYAILYMVSPGSGYLGEIGGGWWHYNGFLLTWPSYFALAFLLSALVSMTIIDARTFTIPIQVPLFAIGCILVFDVLQCVMPLTKAGVTWAKPCGDWAMVGSSAFGALGILISQILLWTGVFKISFLDYDDYVKEGDVLAEYPHARREMKHEILFLTPIILGLVGGWYLGGLMGGDAPPLLLQVLGGTGMGYFMGAGLVWAIRILGTLSFGREAMGLGDVHLLGAVGAGLGWFEPILIFFVAPFSGILWFIFSAGIGVIFKGLDKELPYGPHLAVATLLVVLGRPAIADTWAKWFRDIPLPQAERVVDQPDQTEDGRLIPRVSNRR